MRKLAQHFCTFVAGGLLSLITPLVLLENGKPLIWFWIAVLLLVVAASWAWWKELSIWLHLIRAEPATYPNLRVQKIVDMDHIWARHELGLLLSVHMSPEDRARPNVREGERISVTGKSTKRMKGGRIEVVQAKVRSYDI